MFVAIVVVVVVVVDVVLVVVVVVAVAFLGDKICKFFSRLLFKALRSYYSNRTKSRRKDGFKLMATWSQVWQRNYRSSSIEILDVVSVE